MEIEPTKQKEQARSQEISEQEKKTLVSRLCEQIAEKKGIDIRIFHSLIREINISNKDLKYDEYTNKPSGSDLKIDALWFPGEGRLEIKPHFFNKKSEAEQQHILAHEFAHSLEPFYSRNANISKLIESFNGIYDSEYIQNVDEKRQSGERTTDIIGAFLHSKTLSEFQNNLISISNHPDKEKKDLLATHEEAIAELFIELEENLIRKLKTQTPQEIYSSIRRYDFAYDFIEEGFGDENPTWSMSDKKIGDSIANAKPNQSFLESVKTDAHKFASYGFWGFFK